MGAQISCSWLEAINQEGEKTLGVHPIAGANASSGGQADGGGKADELPKANELKT